ncbi:MAG: hypothetical protein CMI23_07850 [Opitutae bacterium]|nr:hypothetical protein [Opitutae bacterium]|tara:strand:+ start:1798 stop:1980 length:183 start_codon:yes stop_codon:yes gene_type:complete
MKKKNSKNNSASIDQVHLERRKLRQGKILNRIKRTGKKDEDMKAIFRFLGYSSQSKPPIS